MALSVRELELDSYLGQPLSARISVRLQPGESLEDHCLRLLPADDPASAVGPVRLSWRPQPNGGFIILQGATPLTEPIVRLNLSVGCEAGKALRREFVAFLDPESFRAPRLPEAGAVAAASQPVALPKRRTSYPRLGNLLEIQGNESLNDIARYYFPLLQSNRDKLIAYLQQQYPELPSNRNLKLSPGLKLQLPTRDEVGAQWPSEQTAETAPTAEMPPQQQAQAPISTRSALPLELGGTGRPSGVLPQAPLPTPTPNPARDRLILSSPNSQTPLPPSASNIERLEQVADKLLSTSDDQHAELGQLQHRLEQLEKQLKHMSVYLEQQQNELDQERTRSNARDIQVRRLQNLSILAAVIIGAGLLLVFLLRWFDRRRPKRTIPVAVAPSLEPRQGPDWPSEDSKPASPPFATSPQSFSKKAETTGTFEQLDDVEVIQHTSVLEQAMLFAECGLPEKSIELLRQEIATRPAHVAAWMGLFRVLHGEGMAEEFRIQALEFRSHFASEGLWQQVSELGRDLAPNDSLYSEWVSPDSSVGLGLDMLQGETPAPAPRSTPPAAAPAVQPSPPEPVPEPPSIILDVPLEFPSSTPAAVSIAKSPVPAMTADEPLVFELPELQGAEEPIIPDFSRPVGDFPDLSSVMIKPPGEITVDSRAREQSNSLARVSEHLGSDERQQAIELLEQLLLSGNWLEKQESLRLLTLLRPVL